MVSVVSVEIGNVDASTIDIVSNEKMDANHFIDGWIVKVNGVQVTISNAQLQSDQKTLYLSIPECISTDVITLTYITQPDTNQLLRNNNYAWTTVDFRK